MTKCDSPADCHRPPVQKLVALNTLTSPCALFSRMQMHQFKLSRILSLFRTVLDNP